MIIRLNYLLKLIESIDCTEPVWGVLRTVLEHFWGLREFKELPKHIAWLTPQCIEDSPVDFALRSEVRPNAYRR